jgi:ferredoxin
VRIVVDWDLCESNGLCMAAAPEVFELQDDDTLMILQETPDEALRPSPCRTERGTRFAARR